jgi:hypothetical protein
MEVAALGARERRCNGARMEVAALGGAGGGGVTALEPELRG